MVEDLDFDAVLMDSEEVKLELEDMQELEINLEIRESGVEVEEKVEVEYEEEVKQGPEPLGQDLQQTFWDFLEEKGELNSTLSGYFCRLFQALVGARPKQVF